MEFKNGFIKNKQVHNVTDTFTNLSSYLEVFGESFLKFDLNL